MLLIDEIELQEIRTRSERWRRADARTARPPATAGTAHDRMRLLEMLDLVREKLCDLSPERLSGDEHTARQRGERIADLKVRFRDACEATRLRYGLSDEECRELWGYERSETCYRIR